jgi:hypothetical protein
MLLEDTRALIDTHGHDYGVESEGRVPLTLVGAMKVAMGYNARRPAWMLPRRSQVLIDCAYSHLESTWGQDNTPPLTFRMWLRYAYTTEVINLIDDTLAGDV